MTHKLINKNINEINREIRELNEKRRQMYKDMEKVVCIEFENIEKQQADLEKQISAEKMNISLHHHRIQSCEANIQNYENALCRLKKEKCKWIGHQWDYDWVQHNEGGQLEEICMICGEWRMD